MPCRSLTSSNVGVFEAVDQAVREREQRQGRPQLEQGARQVGDHVGSEHDEQIGGQERDACQC